MTAIKTPARRSRHCGRMTNRPILTVEEFYAHAIAIEREAA
ncbi:MAG: hypothetical protein ACXWAU_10455 [Usitatibacter sp.]